MKYCAACGFDHEDTTAACCSGTQRVTFSPGYSPPTPRLAPQHEDCHEGVCSGDHNKPRNGCSVCGGLVGRMRNERAALNSALTKAEARLVVLEAERERLRAALKERQDLIDGVIRQSRLMLGASTISQMEKTMVGSLVALLEGPWEHDARALLVGAAPRDPLSEPPIKTRCSGIGADTIREPVSHGNRYHCEGCDGRTNPSEEKERVRAALAPFAAAAVDFNPGRKDDEVFWNFYKAGQPNVSITLGDLRRARAALDQA